MIGKSGENNMKAGNVAEQSNRINKFPVNAKIMDTFVSFVSSLVSFVVRFTTKNTKKANSQN